MATKRAKPSTGDKDLAWEPISASQLNQAPLVLALGTDDFLADRISQLALTQLRKSEPDAARVTVSAADPEAGALLADALAPTLFGDSALVYVTEVEQASAPVQQQIRDALDDPDSSRPLVLWHRNGQAGKAFAQTLRGHEAVRFFGCSAPKKFKLPAFVGQELKSFKRTMAPAAVNALIKAVGDDPRALAGACAQLAADTSAEPIDEADVQQYYGGTASMPGWEISEALWQGNKPLMLQRLRQSLQLQPTVGPAITATLAGDVRGMLAVAKARNDRPGSQPGQLPDFMVKKYREQIRGWDPATLAAVIRTLATLDHEMKGRDVADRGLNQAQQHHLLESTLLQICGLHARHRAA